MSAEGFPAYQHILRAHCSQMAHSKRELIAHSALSGAKGRLALQASTTRLQQTLTGLLARSPFSSALRRGSHSVVAFELDWAHTVGLQYENELCHDGRLVMEVHGVTRREFSLVSVSMGCACGTMDWQRGQRRLP